MSITNLVFFLPTLDFFLTLRTQTIRMETTNKVGYSLNNAYNNTVETMSNFLPNVISALVLFIGMVVANAAGASVKEF